MSAKVELVDAQPTSKSRLVIRPIYANGPTGFLDVAIRTEFGDFLHVEIHQDDLVKAVSDVVT